MAASHPRKSLALDTNLLLDLAAEADFAHTFREVFLERDYLLLVPPTAVEELTHAAIRKSGADQRDAHRALSSLRAWSIQPFEIAPVAHGIAEQFARRLIERGLLPEEESNDGEILAEASLANVPVLVTSDHHLLDIDEARLLTAFNDSDLPLVRPMHPRDLLRAMRPG
jgi:predicted nucleic acid-binding protein